MSIAHRRTDAIGSPTRSLAAGALLIACILGVSAVALLALVTL